MIICDNCPDFEILDSPVSVYPIGFCVMHCKKFDEYFPNGFAAEHHAKAAKCPIPKRETNDERWKRESGLHPDYVITGKGVEGPRGILTYPNRNNMALDKFTNHEEAKSTFLENILIDKIQFIRMKNNQAWMDILRLAMMHAPEKTKKVMIEIAENDAEINELTKELAK